MATMNSESNFDTQGMFSMLSHGREKEKKKTDRKTGKERRKAEKTLRQHQHLDLRTAEHTSTPTIWCTTKNHFGTPILNDKNSLIFQNTCADCKHAEWKKSASVEDLAKQAQKDAEFATQYLSYDVAGSTGELNDLIIAEQNTYFDHYARMEYELDIIEAEEAILQMRLQKMEAWAKEHTIEEAALPYDDYIAEIDDDYDF